MAENIKQVPVNTIPVEAEAEVKNNGKMVTRTFIGHVITYTILNAQNEPENTEVYVPERSAEKAIKRGNQIMNGKGIFRDCKTVEETRGVPIDEFYKMSVKVERPPSQK